MQVLALAPINFLGYSRDVLLGLTRVWDKASKCKVDKSSKEHLLLSLRARPDLMTCQDVADSKCRTHLSVYSPLISSTLTSSFFNL